MAPLYVSQACKELGPETNYQAELPIPPFNIIQQPFNIVQQNRMDVEANVEAVC